MRSLVVLKSNFTNLQVVKASSYVRLKPLSTSFTHRPTEISPSTFSKADASALQVHFLSSCAVQVFFFSFSLFFLFLRKAFYCAYQIRCKTVLFFQTLRRNRANAAGKGEKIRIFEGITEFTKFPAKRTSKWKYLIPPSTVFISV